MTKYTIMKVDDHYMIGEREMWFWYEYMPYVFYGKNKCMENRFHDIGDAEKVVQAMAEYNEKEWWIWRCWRMRWDKPPHQYDAKGVRICNGL